MSVRSPGIVLGNRQTKFKSTNTAWGARSHSPELFPNYPSLEVGLQHVKRERRESDNVGVDEVDNS